MAEEEKHHLPPFEQEEDPHHHHSLPAPENPHPHRHPDHHNHPQKMVEGKHRRVYNEDYRPKSTRRNISMALLILLLIGITVLTLYLVYRPEEPKFRIVGAAIYNLNITPPLISTTMQFTLITRNPNKRVSIYYDRLSTFVSYRNQAITAVLQLPPLHHEVKSTVAVSPVVGGAAVPVAVQVANGLAMDQTNGVVSLRVVVMGRLRYKAGAIKTGHYGVYVKCDIMVGMKKGLVGQMSLLGSSGCKVDI